MLCLVHRCGKWKIPNKYGFFRMTAVTRIAILCGLQSNSPYIVHCRYSWVTFLLFLNSPFEMNHAIQKYWAWKTNVVVMNSKIIHTPQTDTRKLIKPKQGQNKCGCYSRANLQFINYPKWFTGSICVRASLIYRRRTMHRRYKILPLTA